MWGRGERRGYATPSLRVVNKGAGSEASKKGGFKAKGRGKRASYEWQGQDEGGGTLSKLWTSVLTQGSCPEARPKLGGAQMEGMAGTLGRGVCACRRTPHPPLDPPPHTPGAWGSELTLRPAGQGRPVPGGCALWPPPSPVLSGSVPTLRSWWLAPDLHITEGPEGRD